MNSGLQVVDGVGEFGQGAGGLDEVAASPGGTDSGRELIPALEAGRTEQGDEDRSRSLQACSPALLRTRSNPLTGSMASDHARADDRPAPPQV